jgi:hypothetical protein
MTVDHQRGRSPRYVVGMGIIAFVEIQHISLNIHIHTVSRSYAP